MKVFKIFSKSVVLPSALLFISFIFSSCASSPAGRLLSREGANFNKDLSQAIRSADKMTIVEHSFWEDFKGTNSNVDVRTAPKYTYRRKTLTASDKAYFASQVDKLSGAKKLYNHEGCMFAPHYTIYFYKNGKTSSSAQISHRCEDFKWKNGSSYTQSKNLFSALNETLKKAGFDPNSNWKKKASDRYKSNNRKKIEKDKKKKEKEVVKSIGVPTAKPVPGKEGLLVYNPFTQNQVDVEGIPAGTKIRDPQDPKGRVFRVP